MPGGDRNQWRGLVGGDEVAVPGQQVPVRLVLPLQPMPIGKQHDQSENAKNNNPDNCPAPNGAPVENRPGNPGNCHQNDNHPK
jgi:hypothetical protein